MNETTLLLTSPAGRWLDAFPIGNGRMGAMIFGGTAHERLALNHENLWRGVTRDRTAPKGAAYLPAIREKFLAGQLEEGTELAIAHLSGHQRRVQPYQPFGDLILDFPAQAEATDYQRCLDLRDGIAGVRYTVNGVGYTREAFASAEHGVIVLRLQADQPGAFTGSVALGRLFQHGASIKPWSDGARLGFRGHFEEGITFAVEARVVASGGQVTPGAAGSVQVQGADGLLIVLTMGVEMSEPDPVAWCARHLDGVPIDYAVLRDAHLAEHRPLLDRVTLEVGGDPAVAALPLDARLRRIREGADDPALAALYFHYGRYLLLGSSRKCDQPANLQGIWNEEVAPPWESDFHHDINLEMNYWPAEVCNLAECAEPLFAYLQRAIPQGQQAARDLFGCRGIWLAITGDIWNCCTPEAPLYDVWMVGAAWLSEHLWWRWEYTRDEAFLREQTYPFLKQVADFYADFLVRDAQGRLVTVPTQSPENGFIGGSLPVSLCVGATIDLVLIREVLGRCLQASERLGVDAELRAGWEAILRDIPPFQIGKHGQLQEWLEDREEAEPGHRHFSHLLGIFPGEAMTPDCRPEFYQAARVSLERRLASGGGHTGWSRAWTAMLWARFREGGLSFEHLQHLISDFSTDSLLDLHPPQIFQIDGNLGGTAAVAEMLLQSHGGTLHLLPALPPQWPAGRVCGLRARGGYTVDMGWQDGRITEARLHSSLGEPCRVAWPGACTATINDRPVSAERDADGCLTFHPSAGDVLVLRG